MRHSTMTEPMSPTALAFAKPIGGIIGAATAYTAEIASKRVDGIPSWITELGLPTGFLICVIYALVSTNKALRESERGRLHDRDEFVDAIRQDARQATETHQRLIEASVSQRMAFEKQAEAFDRHSATVDKLAEKISIKL